MTVSDRVQQRLLSCEAYSNDSSYCSAEVVDVTPAPDLNLVSNTRNTSVIIGDQLLPPSDLGKDSRGHEYIMRARFSISW